MLSPHSLSLSVPSVCVSVLSVNMSLPRLRAPSHQNMRKQCAENMRKQCAAGCSTEGKGDGLAPGTSGTFRQHHSPCCGEDLASISFRADACCEEEPASISIGADAHRNSGTLGGAGRAGLAA